MLPFSRKFKWKLGAKGIQVSASRALTARKEASSLPFFCSVTAQYFVSQQFDYTTQNCKVLGHGDWGMSNVEAHIKEGDSQWALNSTVFLTVFVKQPPPDVFVANVGRWVEQACRSKEPCEAGIPTPCSAAHYTAGLQEWLAKFEAVTTGKDLPTRVFWLDSTAGPGLMQAEQYNAGRGLGAGHARVQNVISRNTIHGHNMKPGAVKIEILPVYNLFQAAMPMMSPDGYHGTQQVIGFMVVQMLANILSGKVSGYSERNPQPDKLCDANSGNGYNCSSCATDCRSFAALSQPVNRRLEERPRKGFKGSGREWLKTLVGI
jgi:hypothetical protein